MRPRTPSASRPKKRSPSGRKPVSRPVKREKIPFFSRAIPSREPSRPMCAVPMLVIRARSGRTMSASAAISPGWLTPISSTAQRCAAPTWKQASGTPVSEFRLPPLTAVEAARERIAPMISLVVVLPLEPVTPTRAARPSRPRWTRASRCSAAERVGHGDDGDAPCAQVRELGPPRGDLGLAHQQRPGAGRDGRGQEPVAVGALAAQGHEQRVVARPRGSRWRPSATAPVDGPATRRPAAAHDQLAGREQRGEGGGHGGGHGDPPSRRERG